MSDFYIVMKVEVFESNSYFLKIVQTDVRRVISYSIADLGIKTRLKYI